MKMAKSLSLVQRLDGVSAATVYNGERVDLRPVLIVIGGGFAGLLACRKMHKEFKVVLIDTKEYFEFYPGICRAYVHPREHRKLSRHYQPICDALAVEFLWGEALSVDLASKTVLVKEIAGSEPSKRKYDYLLVATGSQYGIDLVHPKRVSHGTECLWYPTFLESGIAKSQWAGLDERFLLGRRKHLEQEYHELIRLHESKATILIIGAGFVGIEFATEVKYYFPGINVAIVESRNSCVGVMPEKCINYGQDYLDRNGIKTLYGEQYTKFLSSGAAKADADSQTQLKSTFDNLAQLSSGWGIDEPSRIYMAVGLRPINQFLPEDVLTPKKGSRGGWIKANSHQQVLSPEGPVPNVYAAGNCCEIEGLTMPKNSFPAEEMAAVACHNMRVEQAKKDPAFGGCFGFLKPRQFKKAHWNWGVGLCSTSLGPHDATLVVGSSPESGSGYTVLTGYLSALNKEFIRWSKVDQVAGGCLGSIVWALVH